MELKAAYEQRQTEIQHPGDATHHAALACRQGGGREGLRGAERKPRTSSRRRRPSWASRRATSNSDCSRASDMIDSRDRRRGLRPEARTSCRSRSRVSSPPCWLRVSEMVPGKQRTFDEVKGEIGDRLAEERANRELQDAAREASRTSATAGKPLKEIGEELKLPFLRNRRDRSQRARPPTASRRSSRPTPAKIARGCLLR